MASRNQARTAKKLFVESLSKKQKSQVIGVGITTDPQDSDGYAVSVNLTADSVPGDFPKRVSGVKIVFTKTGIAKAL